MNLPFSFRQKIKIALFLFCIMVCSLLIRFLEDKSIKSMGTAFTSIFNDRLVPATDLFQVAEHIFGKSSVLDIYLHEDHAANYSTIRKNLAKHDLAIDSLIKKYESTYLVVVEKGGLAALKKRIAQNRVLESNILANSNVLTEKERAAFVSQLNRSYSASVKDLSGLTKVQSKVGEDLIKESKKLMVGSQLYSALQLILAILIGALIISILFTANVIKIKNDNFSLN